MQFSLNMSLRPLVHLRDTFIVGKCLLNLPIKVYLGLTGAYQRHSDDKVESKLRGEL